MSREIALDLSMLFAGVGLLLGIFMMIGTTLYLNRSQKRFRFFELGYSCNSEWYKSGKVDFFTANYVMSHMIAAGLRMKGGRGAEKVRISGSPLAPYLHLDRNYEKLFLEFPSFIRYELIKFAVIAASIMSGVVGMGLDKGWW